MTTLTTSRNHRNRDLQLALKHDCFTKQTPEADFWAGYIAADGCIVGSRIQLSCMQSDREFLGKFRRWVGSQHKISQGLSNKTSTCHCQLAFKSEQMIADLGAYYNIRPRKSLNAIPPTRESLHFVAGLWMGDGHISWANRRQHYTCGFCGSKEMMEWVRHYFSDLTAGKVTPTGPIYEFAVGGRENAPKVLQRIFHSAPFVLDRKYKLYQDCLSRVGT